MQALPTRVVIASKNPVKINAVREAFRRALPHLQLEFSGEAGHHTEATLTAKPCTSTSFFKQAVSKSCAAPFDAGPKPCHCCTSSTAAV